ncbi:MAG: hypothetical protein H6739_17490 [Alphaproteobacteria bacterium]|nr:hypothetical protein [Alphaproteobacteria bacterium]
MPVPHHHLQELDSSCMAACLRMVLSRAGVARGEHEVREALGPPPLTLECAEAFGDHYPLDPDNPANLDFLLQVVDRGWCLVEVRGGPAAHNAGLGGLNSPHGALALPRHGLPLEMTATPHHIIVLTAQESGALTYLDPWYSSSGQPLRVNRTDFIASWWTGALLVPSDLASKM